MELATDSHAVQVREHWTRKTALALAHALEPFDLLFYEEPLRYDDILALIRATHKTRTDTRAEVTQKKMSVGRALMTGGVMMTKSVKSEERSTSTDREQVLYIFRSSGETPWILRERATSYAALGAAAAPSSFQNFMTTIARLRASAPSAVFDERLTAPGVATGGLALSVKTSSVGSKESVTTATSGGVDLLAHLIALWIAKIAARKLT